MAAPPGPAPRSVTVSRSGDVTSVSDLLARGRRGGEAGGGGVSSSEAMSAPPPLVQRAAPLVAPSCSLAEDAGAWWKLFAHGSYPAPAHPGPGPPRPAPHRPATSHLKFLVGPSDSSQRLISLDRTGVCKPQREARVKVCFRVANYELDTIFDCNFYCETILNDRNHANSHSVAAAAQPAITVPNL